jgi:hypothetical protein
VIKPHRAVLVTLILAGVVAAALGLRIAPERLWPTLLHNGFYLLSLGVSAMFFLSTQRLTGARWSASLRRVPEALMAVLPTAALLMLALYLGRHALYPWSRPGALTAMVGGKAIYLQAPFVFARMAAVLLIWNGFAWLFRRASLLEDRGPGLLFHHHLNRLAAIFAVVFALSFTVAAYDWLLSLDPGWTSTMFAVYVFAGTFVQGIAAVTLAVVWLKRRRLLVVSDAQLHDLGKLLFAFSTFWAYIWTCQYLLIWYGNIPEEVSHYLIRTRAPWLPLFAVNLMMNWVVPFAVLLSARTKRRPAVLATVSVLLLIGHWLDLYLLIMPAVSPTPTLGALEIAVTAGHVCLGIWIFLRSLSRAPLVPLGDPVLLAEKGAAP